MTGLLKGRNLRGTRRVGRANRKVIARLRGCLSVEQAPSGLSPFQAAFNTVLEERNGSTARIRAVKVEFLSKKADKERTKVLSSHTRRNKKKSRAINMFSCRRYHFVVICLLTSIYRRFSAAFWKIMCVCSASFVNILFLSKQKQRTPIYLDIFRNVFLFV